MLKPREMVKASKIAQMEKRLRDLDTKKTKEYLPNSYGGEGEAKQRC